MNDFTSTSLAGQSLGESPRAYRRVHNQRNRAGLVTLAVVLLSPTALQAAEIIPGQTRLKASARLQASPAGPAQERVHLFVHLTPNANRALVRAFANGRGGQVRYEYKILPHTMALRDIPAGALRALERIPGVVRVEQQAEVHVHLDDSLPLIRGLQTEISGAGFSADGAGVRICIIDTGIDSDHAMYADRIDFAAGRDFVNNDNDPEDDNFHGSHVAGIAAGRADLNVDFGCGSEPFQGVAPLATLIGVKSMNASGNGLPDNIIAGIDYCADQSPTGGRADVINMSLGATVFAGNCDTDTMAAASNSAVDAGVVVVASSGNDASANGLASPSCGSKVISVGATYDNDYPNCEFPTQTSFEFCTCVFFGICCGNCTDVNPSVDQITCMSNQSTELDVTAPGCRTFSADFENSVNGIVGVCGTSMASPHVAGLAALLLSADPSLTPAEVRQFIRAGAIDLGAAGFDSVYGHGRIDVLNSLSLLGPVCGTPADCDDADACTFDDCIGGSCSHIPMDCDDGDGCTTDTCSNGICANNPTNCDDGNVCTADGCDPGSGCTHVSTDCDDADACTTDSCDPVSGACVNAAIGCDDGDLCTSDSCDPGSGCVNDPVTCPAGQQCVGGICELNDCDADGTCEVGEDCNSCPGDCYSSMSTSCGPSCCGDGVCEGSEEGFNCEVDCGPPEICGNGSCGGGEDQCNCASDCGTPPSSEVDCADGLDEDCDGNTDCGDADCSSDPACQCTAVGDPCTTDSDCCSNKCRGAANRKTCK